MDVPKRCIARCHFGYSTPPKLPSQFFPAGGKMGDPPWGASSPRERFTDSNVNVSLKFSKRARAPGEKGELSDSKSLRSLGGDSDPEA